MKVDWQAYESGQMSREESERIACWLASDADARADFEGFLRFKQQVREAGLAVDVPLAALREKVAVTEKPRRWMAPLGLAAAVLILAMVFVPFMLGKTRDPLAVHSLAVTDPVKAATFARRESGMNVGNLDPRPVADLQSVSCNKYWVKYHYVYRGQPVVLSLDLAGKKLFRSGLVKRNGGRFYVTDKQNLASIYWRDGLFDFTLFGLKLEDSWALVDHLWAQTSTWPRPIEVGSRNGPTQGDRRTD